MIDGENPPCGACGRPMTLGQPGMHFSCMPTCGACLHPYEGDRHRHSDYGDVKKQRLAEKAAARGRGVTVEQLEDEENALTLWGAA